MTRWVPIEDRPEAGSQIPFGRAREVVGSSCTGRWRESSIGPVVACLEGLGPPRESEYCGIAIWSAIVQTGGIGGDESSDRL